MKRLTLFLAAVALAVTSSAAQADLLFDRGLPSLNLNNAAGADRSNVTWASGNPTGFTGDDFVIGNLGQTFVIDSLVVWGAQYDPLSLDINNIWLYLGKSGQALALASTGTVTGNNNSNPNITHTFVNYPGGTTSKYVGNGGVEYPIAQTTFGGLNLVVEGGVKYNFGVMGDKYLWWNHASNAALSGTPQQGADGKYLEFDSTNLGVAIVQDSNGNGWDKSSDINVQINGRVPEPTTLGLLGLGLVALARRTRKNS